MGDEVNILSLDTTSKNCSISIARAQNIITEYNFTSTNTLSSMLIPSIEFVLEAASLRLGDIDIFGIGVGPGVFTGIRIGLSTLKGLIFGKQVPVVPVLTLKAWAQKFKDLSSEMIPLIPAKREEVYMAGYIPSGGVLKESIKPDLVHIEKLKSKLGSHKDFCIIGEGADLFGDFLEKSFKNIPILVRSPYLSTEIAHIAFHEHHNGNSVLDLGEIRPFYLKKPDAETNRTKRAAENRKSRSQ